MSGCGTIPSRQSEPLAGLSRIELAGLGVHNVDERACVRHVVREASAGRGGRLLTLNTDIAYRSTVDGEVRRLVESSELLVADGMPLIWASRVRGAPLPERVCGSNLIRSVSRAAAEAGLSIFLLGGGTPKTAERAAAALRRRYAGLQVAGTYYPPFGFEKDPEQTAQMVRSIEQARPDIVFVALSFPKSERLVERLRAARPRAWWIGVGISFSFECGEVRRAPKWMQRIGLEWVHRMAQEPRRLARRYLVHDLPFALRLLGHAAWQRVWPGAARAREGGG